MSLKEVIAINDKIEMLENQLNTNGKEFINKLYELSQMFQKENDGKVLISDFNNVQFSIKFGRYEIFVTLMDEYAVPKFNMLEMKNIFIALNKIADNISYQKYYCGCISFYYCDKSFNPDSLIFLDRAFFNKDFDIAFQWNNSTLNFESKEVIFNNLDNIFIGIIKKIYNFQPYFPEVDNILQLDKEIISKRRFEKIGFK